MPVIKPLIDMNQDAIRYLAQNTDITFFANGSIAKAMVEATNLEISRLQDYVSSSLQNAFLSSASGIYLDIFGETLGVPRIRNRRAILNDTDRVIRFYVDTGTLGSRLVNPSDPSTGLIPMGVTIQNPEGSIRYVTTSDTTFPVNARKVYVPAAAENTGAIYNVGTNQLTIHNLGNSEVKVTNDISITSGSDIEVDTEYRFRLSRIMTARFGSNSTAIQLAAVTQPGVSRVELLQYARGAGTFDVLLIPQGNRITRSTIDSVKRSIDQVVAYGISSRIKEPEYVPIDVTVQLSFRDGTVEGAKLAARTAAEGSILTYIASIPLGGELIINQIRAVVLGSSDSIKDMQIVELCIDGAPRVIRNVQLRKDELFIPDEDSLDPVRIICRLVENK